MALVARCTVLQVVGFQNSGKTTLVEKLIKKAKHFDIHVGSIKHHGHGGPPDSSSQLKDSHRHQQAGADVAGVEGDGILQLTADIKDWSLKKLIDFYQFFSPDVIFVEGYKKESYPKVVLIRSEEDLVLLSSLTNIICVISHVPLKKEVRRAYPMFHLQEDELYLNFLLKEVGERR
ncbi:MULTISPECIES: molybdopterin-guanine dinucleotide biosynthesis protein B [Priestia]|uniref:molybdopterin-guanine dinucleotide biosynthesis protein B n=1 Tax=Priestia TaxID=2800373 RepID=UPI00203DE49D|nr:MULTISPECIES: molybdopterin-guanine dinucleotide biosynthesis protein B [Priestia]MCM3773187.1 molybdopterin-guanine dinucleotide biosynthesis protein B [Priestia aryabhattai]MDY0942086.1 molybdopterin-guanine dinucleotide biosynthesis protein B [Priestia megaterium]